MYPQVQHLIDEIIIENRTQWLHPLACEDAAIHDLILNMPGGYNSQLIEGGMNLSGGQSKLCFVGCVVA